mmetsp:Transcript_79131/g.218962  ORF Transcript_79131/g.218962 Transcript_79131/m.218962 type:complete len:226 (-) Transcript_79131:200-877(-)
MAFNPVLHPQARLQAQQKDDLDGGIAPKRRKADKAEILKSLNAFKKRLKPTAVAEQPSMAPELPAALAAPHSVSTSSQEGGGGGSGAGAREALTSVGAAEGARSACEEDACATTAASSERATVVAAADAASAAEPAAELRGTFAEVWHEGDEQSAADWHTSSGLKFHTTADKAYAIDARRAKEHLETFDPLGAGGNREVVAEKAKRRGELLAERRREQEKGRQKR